ncbi:MAG: serine/threonine-protein kinase [Archangium sp.]
MQLGRYTVLGRLAVGGMAEVLLARLDGSSGFEREVIIKRVLQQFAGDDDFRRLFEQEARFASFLVHPHIAQVFDFGVDAKGSSYLVMEFVEGASLRRILKASSRSLERPDFRLVCRVFSQLAEALAAVHAAVDPVTKQPLGLIHRDVNPDNVLLSRQGAVKLADFGIARATNEVSTTRPDHVRGKLRYMAPEQLLGLSIGPAIDVWALGVSLYEALTLRRPFPEDNEGATTFAIANVKFPPLDEVRADLPPELVALVHGCLRAAPEERPASCADLALQLERIASGGTSTMTASLVGNWVDRLCPESIRAQLVTLEEPAPFVFDEKTGERVPAAASRFAVVEPAGAAAPVPSPPVVVEPVVVRPPKPPLAPRRGLLRAVGASLVVFALVGGAVYVYSQREPEVPKRQVVVTSSPSGATVKLGNRVLGSTPWAGDLRADSLVELTLELNGFKPKLVVLPPEQVSVDVTLKR